MQKINIKRLRILYYIFFGIIIFSVCFVLLSIINTDKREQGIRVKIRETVIQKDNSFFIASFLKKNNSSYQFDIPIYADSSLVISGRVNTFDALIQGKNLELNKSKSFITGIVFASVALACSLATLVFLGMLFYSFRKSFKKGLIFSKRDIKYIRIIAILLILAPIFSHLSAFFEQWEIAKFLNGTDWATTIIFVIPFMEIIFGVMILFISEFFAIGYQLQEDQELTI